jgi:tetratricopeptide (TPR) repeat protein
MKVLLSIFAYGFLALTTVHGLLLGYRNAEWIKISVLHDYIVPPPFGVWLFISFTIAAFMFNVLLHNFPATSLFEVVKGTQTQDELLTKSNERGLEAEFKSAASEIQVAAKEYFMAGERDFTVAAYEDAARNYEKSISKLETMSAYLNLSVSRYNLANFEEAEKAGEKGLSIARRKEHQIFAGAFLVQLSNVYKNQGKLEDALKCSQQAAIIFETEKDRQNWASALGGIGSIYLNLV